MCSMCHTKSLLFGMVKTVAMTTNANISSEHKHEMCACAGTQLCSYLKVAKDVPKCVIADLYRTHYYMYIYMNLFGLEAEPTQCICSICVYVAKNARIFDKYTNRMEEIVRE